jgi:protein-L-isoaspartate(D-aspartate) O-methyltransferase
MNDPLTMARRWYAEDLRCRTPVLRNSAVIDAFAAVPRERFAGPGPWRIMAEGRPDEPFVTPDDDPRWLYHDVLVSVDATRRLNIGLPSFWAHKLEQIDPARGERVLQVGTGTGYYSAVLAEIVGPGGRVTAVELDAELASRARANLAPWPQVDVIAGDGRTHDPGEVDLVIVFAGSTHPAPIWLDRLAEHGRLVMPLTSESRWGFVLCAVRRANAFTARSIGGVGIFPCIGGRDEDAGRRLQAALEALRRSGASGTIPVSALHRGEPGPDTAGKVWYQAPGFWLEREAAMVTEEMAKS